MALPTTTQTLAHPLPDLAPDPAMVERIRSGIRLQDRSSIVRFGEASQRDVASFADGVLRQVMNKDSGPVGDLLADMLQKAQGLDPADLADLGFLDRLRGGIEAKVARYKGRFGNVETQVDRIKLQLERHSDILLRDIATLDGLFDRNIVQLVGLEAHIVAGTQAIEDARSHELPDLRRRASEAGDGIEGQVLAQQASDLAQAIERMDKRVHDLKLSRIVTLQAMPQIRMVQNGDAILVEKLQTSITTALAIWKNGMVIALAQHNKKGAERAATAVDDTTNALLRRNAEMLRTGTAEVERAAQRGVVDVDTLAYVNMQFIETIREVLSIQREGSQAREAAKPELLRIERELKQTVMGANA
jgi:uncharacterized protein YaaN involved in tellurite resistance